MRDPSFVRESSRGDAAARGFIQRLRICELSNGLVSSYFVATKSFSFAFLLEKYRWNNIIIAYRVWFLNEHYDNMRLF